MKTESGTQPKPYRITVVGNDAIIEFAEQIEAVGTEETIGFGKVKSGIKYVYQSYTLKTCNTPNLEKRIGKNLSAWLAKAKGVPVVKPDPVQEKIDALEARLAKVEAVPIVKETLEPVIIKEPILTK